MSTMIQYVLYLAILVVLAIPLGAYIKNVMSGEKTFLSKVLTPCENLIYKVTRVDREEQMTWKKYAVSVMIFSGYRACFSVPASTSAGSSSRKPAESFRCEMGFGI